MFYKGYFISNSNSKITENNNSNNKIVKNFNQMMKYEATMPIWEIWILYECMIDAH